MGLLVKNWCIAVVNERVPKPFIEIFKEYIIPRFIQLTQSLDH